MIILLKVYTSHGFVIVYNWAMEENVDAIYYLRSTKLDNFGMTL